MTIEDLSKETDDSKKTTLSALIKEYEANVKAQKALKAQAEKEVTRLKEAKNNAENLSRIADEKAAAKEETDAIIEGLEFAKNELRIQVKNAEDTNK